MSQQQREKAPKKLFNANFNDKSTADFESGNYDDNVQMGDQTNPLLNVAVPQYVAEKVWIDSQHLVSTESNVCASPGCTDGNAFLVKSTIATRQRPYFVECKKNGQISSEQSCMLYHSSGVCAHTVAVAQKKGCLDVFLNRLNKRDKLSVTKMANVGLPKGAGKKPHSRRKFSTKASSRQMKKFLETVDGSKYTSRVVTSSTTSCKSVQPGSIPQPSLPCYNSDVQSSCTTTTIPELTSCAPPPRVGPNSPPQASYYDPLLVLLRTLYGLRQLAAIHFKVNLHRLSGHLFSCQCQSCMRQCILVHKATVHKGSQMTIAVARYSTWYL